MEGWMSSGVESSFFAHFSQSQRNRLLPLLLLFFPESLSNSLGPTQCRSSAVKWNQIKEASARCCEWNEDEENAINSVLLGGDL